MGVKAEVKSLRMQLNAGSELARVGDPFEDEGEREAVGGKGG